VEKQGNNLRMAEDNVWSGIEIVCKVLKITVTNEYLLIKRELLE